MAEAEIKKYAQKETRADKKDLTGKQIFNAIRSETSSAMGLIGKMFKEDKQKNAENEYNAFDKKDVIGSNIFETNAFVSESEIRRELSSSLRLDRDFESYEQLEAAVTTEFNKLKNTISLDQLIEVDRGIYTKLSTFENEKKALENLVNISKENRTIEVKRVEQEKNLELLEDFKKAAKFPLKEGQENACRLVAENNNLTIVVGDAGTGKTTSVIAFAAEMNKAKGIKVFGLATQTTTAEAMSEAGIDKKNCLNTKKFFASCFTKSGRLDEEFVRNNKNSVIIVDEAGMVGAEDYRKITDIAKATKSKIILVGDQKQLSSVSYGDTFEQIQERVDRKLCSRLIENTRQVEGYAKDVAEAYRDKNIDKVFDLLEKNDCLVTRKSNTAVIEKIVADYLKDNEKSKVIICGTNQEIDLVNGVCRTKIIEDEMRKASNDKKYKPSLDFKNQYLINVSKKTRDGRRKKDLEFCRGEEIVFLENKKGSFNNGQTGVIKSISQVPLKKGLDIVVEIEGKEVKFNTKDYSSFNHAYALSSHKSQGKTFEHVYHLGSAATNSNKCYVDGSRHKKSYKLYIEEGKVDAYKTAAVKSARKATTVGNEIASKAYELLVKTIKTTGINKQYLSKHLTEVEELKAKSNLVDIKVLEEPKKIEVKQESLPRGLATFKGMTDKMFNASAKVSAKLSNGDVSKMIDEAIERKKAQAIAQEAARQREQGRNGRTLSR